MTESYTSIPDRFWSKVDTRGPDDCWPWLACTASGYGKFGVRYPVTVSAHVFAYHLIVGRVPDGKVLDHACHNSDPTCAGGPTCQHRRCCNPAHMVPKSIAENALASPAHGAHKTHCRNGHEFTPENTYVQWQQSRASRSCRKCRRIACRSYYQRRKAT